MKFKNNDNEKDGLAFLRFIQSHSENECTGDSQKNHSFNHLLVKQDAKDTQAVYTQDSNTKSPILLSRFNTLMAVLSLFGPHGSPRENTRLSLLNSDYFASDLHNAVQAAPALHTPFT